MKNHLTYLMIIASLLLLPKEALARCGYRISESNIFSITLPVESALDVNYAINPGGDLGTTYGYRAPARGRGATAGAHYPASTSITVNLNENFQRIGSVIGRINLSYTQGKGFDKAWGGTVRDFGYNSKHLLFECRTAHSSSLIWKWPSLYEYYALNTGWKGTTFVKPVPRSQAGGLDGVYYTRYKYLGIRVVNSKDGKPYRHTWQKRSLAKSDLVCARSFFPIINTYAKKSCYATQDMSSRVFTPASAFSGVTIEFIRVNNPDKNAITSESFTYTGVNNRQPIAYTLFQNDSHGNPGRPLFNGSRDGYANKRVGAKADFSDLSDKGVIAKSNSHYLNYPMVWRPTVNITRINSCRITDYTKTVDFGSIGAVELRDGTVREKDFSITVACADNVGGSGTMSNQVAMGLLVKGDTAIRKAQQLGLKTSGGGITYLLDNEYGRSGVAQGVGIQVKKIGSSNYLNLLADNSIGGGNNKGWYGYRDLLPSPNGTTSDGIKMYSGKFSAELKRIANQSVTAGSVNAQLEIILALQ